MQTPFRRTAVELLAALLFMPLAYAAEPNALEGRWKEVDDAETTSTLRFELTGTQWIGKYLHVSTHQAGYGYRVGDTIIRGRLEKGIFVGEVFLKAVDANAACPQVGVGWVPATFELVRNGRRLHGTFVDTLVDEEDECKVVGTGLRQYRLERVR